jgi:hypothetical protein
MSPFVSRLAPVLLLSALVATAGPAVAQDKGRGADRSNAGQREARGTDPAARGGSRHDRRQDHRELSDAVRRVERRTGGQVLSAEQVPFDGRNVNRVKVIDSSGRVRVYMDDPQARPRTRGPVSDTSAQED